MAREDEKFVKPDDVNVLPEEQRIAYYVFKLRDVAEQNSFDPGNCNVLMSSRTPQSSAIALRKIGKPAVPVLIGLLDDRRPTRSHNTGFSGHHVVRYCDAALQILDDISGQRFTHFDNRDVLGGTGAFLSNAKPHDRNRITSRIKKWWEQNQHKSESEWIRDVLSRSRISMVWDRIEIARRLIELEGPDSAPFFRRQLKKEPNNAWVLTLLWEAAGKAALEDIRPMIRHRDFAMRKTAYEALVEAGEILRRIRYIKTPDEIHRLRLAALANEKALQEVMKSINDLHYSKTIIIVAHRLSTVENCDSIYKLDKGRVVAKGTPDEIIPFSKVT